MKDECCLHVLWGLRVALFWGPTLNRFPHREGEPGHLPKGRVSPGMRLSSPWGLDYTQAPAPA